MTHRKRVGASVSWEGVIFRRKGQQKVIPPPLTYRAELQVILRCGSHNETQNYRTKAEEHSSEETEILTSDCLHSVESSERLNESKHRFNSTV